MDERIDKLGTYFVYHDIYNRFNITFEKFVSMVDSGCWEQFIYDCGI